MVALSFLPVACRANPDTADSLASKLDSWVHAEGNFLPSPRRRVRRPKGDRQLAGVRLVENERLVELEDRLPANYMYPGDEPLWPEV